MSNATINSARSFTLSLIVLFRACALCRSSSENISSSQAAQSTAAAAPLTTRPLRQSVGRGEYQSLCHLCGCSF